MDNASEEVSLDDEIALTVACPAYEPPSTPARVLARLLARATLHKRPRRDS